MQPCTSQAGNSKTEQVSKAAEPEIGGCRGAAAVRWGRKCTAATQPAWNSTAARLSTVTSAVGVESLQQSEQHGAVADGARLCGHRRP